MDNSLQNYYFCLKTRQIIVKPSTLRNFRQSLYFLVDSEDSVSRIEKILRESTLGVLSDAVLMDELSNLSRLSFYYRFMTESEASVSDSDLILDYVRVMSNVELVESRIIDKLFKKDKKPKGYQEFISSDVHINAVSALFRQLYKRNGEEWDRKLAYLKNNCLISERLLENIKKSSGFEPAAKKLPISKNYIKDRIELFFNGLQSVLTDEARSGKMWFYFKVRKIRSEMLNIEKNIRDVIGRLEDYPLIRNYFLTGFFEKLKDYYYSLWNIRQRVFFYYIVWDLLKTFEPNIDLKSGFNGVGEQQFIEGFMELKELLFVEGLIQNRKYAEIIPDDKDVLRYLYSENNVLDFECMSVDRRTGASSPHLWHIDADASCSRCIVTVFAKQSSSFGTSESNYSILAKYDFKKTDSILKINSHRFHFSPTVFYENFMDFIVNVMAVMDNVNIDSYPIKEADSRAIYRIITEEFELY